MVLEVGEASENNSKSVCSVGPRRDMWYNEMDSVARTLVLGRLVARSSDPTSLAVFESTGGILICRRSGE